MDRSTIRENVALAALSGPAGSINTIVPLYLGYLGHPAPVVGLVIALSSVATLFSRAPVARFYRPERSRKLLIGLLLVGALSYALMPLIPVDFQAAHQVGLLAPELIGFVLMLALNRFVFGMATTVFLARYLDSMGEGTDRRRFMGYYGGTQAIGYTAANLGIGLLADFVSYQAAFLFGTVSAVVGIAVLSFSPELAPRLRAAQAARAERPRGIRGWWHAVADPGLWGVMNGAAWNHILHSVLVTFFPVYAVAIGLSASQVGAARAAYSGLNAVGRFISGFILKHFRLRDVVYGGVALQAGLMTMLPFVSAFPIIMTMFLISAAGRSVVIVANSAMLAEEVNESRVSRGAATSAYSAAPDATGIASPVIAGFIAGAAGTGWMFGAVGMGTLACYALGEWAVQRWKARARSRDDAALVVAGR